MESKFQFTNPVLTAMEFGMNPEFNAGNGEEIQISQSISVEVRRQEAANEATVALIFILGEEGNSCPILLKAVEQANFRWEEGFDENQIEKLLNQNAPSLLLSYLRPIVSQITTSCPIGTYNIPFMNFTRNN